MVKAKIWKMVIQGIKTEGHFRMYVPTRDVSRKYQQGEKLWNHKTNGHSAHVDSARFDETRLEYFGLCEVRSDDAKS